MRNGIVFVCTGNICRSPMAEYLYRAHVFSGGPYRILSAGVSAFPGQPASRFAVKALQELAVDLTPHRSQPVTAQIVNEAALLVVMTRGHRAHLLERFPDAAERIVMLKGLRDNAKADDVMDPIGLSLDVYRHVRDEIATALWDVDRIVKEINGETPGTN